MARKGKGGANMNGVAQAEGTSPAFFNWIPNEQPSGRLVAPGAPAEMPRDGRSDFDLGLELAIAAIARREECGLRELYDATVAHVFGLALRITRNRDVAEDVVADVFHQVWRTALRYDPARGAALTWLLTMCRSRAIDYWRQRDQAESHPDPESLGEAAHQDAHNDTQDMLAAKRRGDALHTALEMLTPIRRQLIGLVFFRGLSHQEAALHLDLPLGTVKTHVRKGLVRLRAALEGDLLPNPSSASASE